MKRAISYSRVSTDEQAEKGFSREEQRERIKKYCEQNSIQIVAEYLEDHSAKTFNRPAFNEIIHLLKTKQLRADVLIVTKIDRFSRNVFEAYNVVLELEKKYGIRVYSLAVVY